MKSALLSFVVLAGLGLVVSGTESRVWAATTPPATDCPSFDATAKNLANGQMEFSEFSFGPASALAWASVCPIEKLDWIKPNLCDLRVGAWKVIVLGAHDAFAVGETTRAEVAKAEQRLADTQASCQK